MTTPTAEAAPDLHNDVRWNLDDLFCGINDPQIEATLDAALARAEQFQADYKGRINVSDVTAQTLGAALREYEAITNESVKPQAYASLLFSTDTADPKRGAFLQKMRERGTALSLPLLFFELELVALPDVVIEPLLDTPEVAPYRHYVQASRLYRDHVLPEDEERLLEETSNTGPRAFRRLFSQVTSATVFRMDDEELNQAQVIAKLSSADRGERCRAASALTQGLQGNLPTVTFIANTLLQDKAVRDRLRHYSSPEQARHLANELSPETVDLVVETVVRHYSLVARYYHVKREILALDTMSHYDRYAPLFEAEGVETFLQARDIVVHAFGAFSPRMGVLAGEFFDKGWIDAPPSPGKEGGAFCSFVTPDRHPYVFLNFMGRMRDVMTLAHELGHGVHASISRKQTLFNHQGTLPLAELASTLGEMLVFERLVDQASLKDKLALYAQKIDDTLATIPRQTALYRFEQAIHRHRRSEGELTSDQFGDYWQREVQAMFGDSVELGDEHRVWWSYISHFIGSPFYVYAYSFGELLALSLFQRSRLEGQAFAERYLDMLSEGGSRTPQELMSQVGVDMDDPKFWQGGFDVLTGMIARFEELWQEYRQAPQ